MRAINGEWRHICVDMQRMFAEQTPWQVPWMRAVSPQVVEVSSRHSDRTIFTRFIPPQTADAAPGMWRHYYEKWAAMTRSQLAAELLDVVPQLSRFAPPAMVFDKPTYSPWIDGRLHSYLQEHDVGTIVVSGGETDVCVLATALGGIDLGYQTIVLSDAVCSSADETHDASMKLLGDRFSVQLELMLTETFLSMART
ncbi:cysteine hydrolase [bacterium]|nr:MAG: cysteine hydrolase [bacterium]